MNTNTPKSADEPTTIGGRIKQLREARDYSQLELGQQVHVDKSTVSRWENGKLRPNPDIVAALANLFGVTTVFLLYGRNTDESNGSILDLNGLTYYQIDLVKKLVAELRGC